MTRFYGGQDEWRNTIHATDYLDIETNEQGIVTQVWFRCSTLPFKQYNTRDKVIAIGNEAPRINGIVFEEK